MKISKSVLLIISLITALSVTAQRENKTEKAARLEQDFQDTVSLVETNQFMVKIDRVFPQGGHDLTRFNPRGEISIKDSIAEGQLPFFGRAYSLPYG